MMGTAKSYVIRIHEAFKKAGYKLRVEPYLLDASKMGVPQRRKRVFFIALRNDLSENFMESVDMFQIAPKLDLEFNEPNINFREIYDGKGKPITDYKLEAWKHRKITDKGIADSKKNAGMKVSDFNHVYLFMDKVMPTITGKAEHAMSLFNEPIKPSVRELMLGGSYPLDYKYSNMGYLIGMSVPPVMVAQVASKIYEQWISKF
jgi:DNA (cytosine-5)-methyltransferase 1